ncbi:STAS domain-containing protein [Planctobacterium marinum]|uniref:STAS domain-containing protein n=1 Tax=Planctobacterium marinum TaxID=1631968 RepID=UPI001E491334|nr:STAS domain-containing protein [Planctobacterium marinum]MCC2604483.1 STAS domain-containing protein [Planctobacterium marinum]
MSVERELSGDGKTLTIILDDKFDFSKVQEFRDAYAEDIESVSTVIVDLGHTEYMDSSALGMLLNMQKSLKEQVSDFQIVNSRPAVAKILQISRFDKKFTIK